MEIGLALPQYDFSVPGEDPLRWSTVAAWASKAEELGFGSVWLSDHLFLDLARYGAGGRRYGTFDPVVALGALARTTGAVRLGTLTFCAPLRPAGVLAKALATLDRLCGGRLVVGLGAGWYEPEMLAAGLPLDPPGQRLARLAESVQVVKGLLGGGPFTFGGRYERIENAPCLPPAVGRSVPVWVGGRGDRLLEVAARWADGWNTVWAWTFADYAGRLAVLDRACHRAGRDPASVTRSLGLHALVGEDEADLARRFARLQSMFPDTAVARTGLDEWRIGRLVGTVDEVAGQLRGWSDLGVGTLVAGLGAVPFSVGAPDDLEVLAAACNLAGCRTSGPAS